MAAEQLSLFCWVVGDEEDNTFKIEIGKENDVADLKKAIKEDQSPRFDGSPANKLRLWRVSLSYEGFVDNAITMIQGQSSLQPNARLFTEFNGEIVGDVHIIVQPPPPSKFSLLISSLIALLTFFAIH